jgi:indole-3-glycerol phosphate synthase
MHFTTCDLQVHTEAELARVLEVSGVENHLLGINNRDLGTFKVDLGLTDKLMACPAGQQVRACCVCRTCLYVQVPCKVR